MTENENITLTAVEEVTALPESGDKPTDTGITFTIPHHLVVSREPFKEVRNATLCHVFEAR